MNEIREGRKTEKKEAQRVNYSHTIIKTAETKQQLGERRAYIVYIFERGKKKTLGYALPPVSLFTTAFSRIPNSCL